MWAARHGPPSNRAPCAAVVADWLASGTRLVSGIVAKPSATAEANATAGMTSARVQDYKQDLMIQVDSTLSLLIAHNRPSTKQGVRNTLRSYYEPLLRSARNALRSYYVAHVMHYEAVT